MNQKHYRNSKPLPSTELIRAPRPRGEITYFTPSRPGTRQNRQEQSLARGVVHETMLILLSRFMG